MESRESKIAEHKKHREDCRARIKSGSQTVAFLVVAGGLLTWFFPNMWPLAIGVVGFVTFTVLIEVWAYRRHDKALRDLKD